jgi:drug/metabolite transporter (DMT)-like permease
MVTIKLKGDYLMDSKLGNLIIGVAFVLGASLTWGLIFVVPQLMMSFNPFEIAFVRYIFYGLVSCAIFLKQGWKKRERFSLEIWKKSFLLTFIFSLAYYPCVVLGLRYADPALATLVIGLSPVMIALYGNWKVREVKARVLILPLTTMIFGLACLNFKHSMMEELSSYYIMGIGYSLIALFVWSWYVVTSAHFLKTNPTLTSSQWATLNGITTLCWVLIFIGILFLYMPAYNWNRFFIWSHETQMFLAGTALLGGFCSWVGIYLWNRSTAYLPITLGGQLTIFETIFGIMFIYLQEQRLPTVQESLSLILFFIASSMAIYKLGNLSVIDEGNSV